MVLVIKYKKLAYEWLKLGSCKRRRKFSIPLLLKLAFIFLYLSRMFYRFFSSYVLLLF